MFPSTTKRLIDHYKHLHNNNPKRVILRLKFNFLSLMIQWLRIQSIYPKQITAVRSLSSSSSSSPFSGFQTPNPNQQLKKHSLASVHPSMDLRPPPCNLYSSIPRNTPLFRGLTYRPSRSKVTSELQSTAGVAVRTSDDQTQAVPTHKVTVHDRFRGVTHQFLVPEDQYILHTAENQNILLPFACRHGCCTSCAVRIKSGELRQPEALGISAELKEQGYALLCVGFPMTDLEVETQDEDEVYWLQFGRYFARGPIERDDYALELAMGDE